MPAQEPAEPQVSVVIPVYDAPDLAGLVGRLVTTLDRTAKSYEVVLVDDASPSPRVWPELIELAARYRQVRALQLTRNFGQTAATLCGLAAARGTMLVTMDDDLQHPPEELPKLLGAPEADLVMGQFEQRHHGLWRRLASRSKGRFDRWLLGKPAGVELTSFRRLSRPLVDAILAQRTPHPFLPGLLLRVSRDLRGVAVEHAPRHAGHSGYTLRRLLRQFSHLLIGHSNAALRALAGLGVASAVASFGIAAALVARKLQYGIPVPGWTSIVVAQLSIGGLLLLATGLIGEVLIRILETVEGRPPFVVRRASPAFDPGASGQGNG